MILATFDTKQSALSEGGRVYIHCSAGIHRSGLITYAFLRRKGHDELLLWLEELMEFAV